MPSHQTSVRAGAALVLALILLAALLLLGLPFLYSQSASLSGTRSYSDATRARIGAESAEHLATAIAAYAMTPYLRAPKPSGGDAVSSATSLEATFSAANPDVPPSLAATVIGLNARTGNRADDDGSIGLDPEKLGLGFNEVPARGSARSATYLGASITDESGKLDPNLVLSAVMI